MNKQQAWEILVQATANISTSRDNHEKIKEALVLLKPEVKPEVKDETGA